MTALKLIPFPTQQQVDPEPTAPRMTKGPESQDVTFDFSLPESGKMQEAEKFLMQHCVNYRVTSAQSIKIAHINYSPDKGSVWADGHKKFKHTGLNFLLELLRREGLAK